MSEIPPEIPPVPPGMPAPAADVPAWHRPAPVLLDPVPSPRRIPLDGAMERAGFPPLVLAAAALVGALIATNVVGVLGAVVLVAGQVQDGAELDAGALMAQLVEEAGTFLTLNALGQLVGFALLGWAFARGSSSRPGLFLRWRAPEAGAVGLAVLGLIAITPVVQWLGGLTDTLPLPPWLQELENNNARIIEEALVGSGLSPLFLLAVMALTPALCEELLFRGYVHRQVERRLGPAWAVGLVGVVFGLYHLSPTKSLPLAVLGVWLGYLTWTTGSLWPAVVVHFLNNAFAVGAATYVERVHGGDLEALESAEMPLWAVGLGALGTLAVAWALRARRAHLAAAPPPPALPDPASP